MAIRPFVVNTLLASLIGAAPATAQDAMFAQAQFIYETGTPGLRVPVETKVVKGAPFSADIVTESIQTLSDGNRIVQRTTTRFYRDTEGRVRREEDRGTGTPSVSITDPVAGTSLSLDVENRTAMRAPNMMTVHVSTALQKVQMNQSTIAIVREPFELDRKPEDVRIQTLPDRTIEGMRAQGVRRTTTIAAGSIGNDLPIETVSEEWTSPDLKVLLLTEHRDPRMGTSTYRVSNINRAEPDAYLFEVPSDFTLKPADTFLRRFTAPAK